MKDLLLLCTKNVYFSYDNKLYSQMDGVAMGSPLGPVIAGIFMVDLERNMIPKLSTHMLKWKRYVDDTITYMKSSSINYVLPVLNFFHKNIKFTFEEEKDNKISFLDVLILRNCNSIETRVYRKFTHNDVYLHWNSISPNSCKVGILKTLLLRAFVICSNEQLLNKEIEHVRNVFHDTNGYPKAVIQNVLSKVKEEQSAQSVKITESHQDDVSKSYLLTLPYKGKRGEKTLRTITKEVKKILPDKHKAALVYTGTKLGSNFNIKDITMKEHKHDLVYSVKCPEGHVMSHTMVRQEED